MGDLVQSFRASIVFLFVWVIFLFIFVFTLMQPVFTPCHTCNHSLYLLTAPYCIFSPCSLHQIWPPSYIASPSLWSGIPRCQVSALHTAVHAVPPVLIPLLPAYLKASPIGQSYLQLLSISTSVRGSSIIFIASQHSCLPQTSVIASRHIPAARRFSALVLDQGRWPAFLVGHSDTWT